MEFLITYFQKNEKYGPFEGPQLTDKSDCKWERYELTSIYGHLDIHEPR